MSYITLGERSGQLMTDITNMCPMETTQENLSENAHVCASTLAQRKKIYNRNYYQRSKEKNISVVNSQGTYVMGSEQTNRICLGLTQDNFDVKNYDIIIIICTLE